MRLLRSLDFTEANMSLSKVNCGMASVSETACGEEPEPSEDASAELASVGALSPSMPLMS